MSVMLVMFNIIISTVPVAFMCLIFFGSWLFKKLACIWFCANLYLMKLYMYVYLVHEKVICVVLRTVFKDWRIFLCTKELNYMYFRRRQRRTWQTECRPLWRRETSTGSRYSKRRRITTQNSYRPRQGDFIILNMEWLRQSYKIQELC